MVVVHTLAGVGYGGYCGHGIKFSKQNKIQLFHVQDGLLYLMQRLCTWLPWDLHGSLVTLWDIVQSTYLHLTARKDFWQKYVLFLLTMTLFLIKITDFRIQPQTTECPQMTSKMKTNSQKFTQKSGLVSHVKLRQYRLNTNWPFTLLFFVFAKLFSGQIIFIFNSWSSFCQCSYHETIMALFIAIKSILAIFALFNQFPQLWPYWPDTLFL